MMLRIAAASVIVLAPAAFAVGIWQGQHETPVALTTGVRLNAPIITKPGFGAAGAAKYFATLNPPPPPPRPSGAPPPPPPDIGLLFRTDVSAVTTGPVPRVILAGGKTLARGEVYRDGWKVREVRNDSVTLVKGAETRSINLFSAPPAAPQAVATSGLGAQISLTNGLTPGKLTTGQINRIIEAFRAAGMTQVQLDQMRKSLESGGVSNLGSVMQSLQGLMRGGRPLSQTQISGIIQAFAAAGVVPPQLTQQLTQQMLQLQQQQQLQGVFGGGRGGGGRGPNGGFGGGFGGGFNPPSPGGGRNRGGLGLTPPPSTQTPAVSAPDQPRASLDGARPKLAALSGSSTTDGTTIR